MYKLISPKDCTGKTVKAVNRTRDVAILFDDETAIVFSPGLDFDHEAEIGHVMSVLMANNPLHLGLITDEEDQDNQKEAEKGRKNRDRLEYLRLKSLADQGLI